MRQLSGQDATFVFLEDPAVPLHLTSLYIYDPATAPKGKVTHKQLLTHIESRLPRSKVYTQKLHRVPLNLDFPYWVDDPGFDLEFHIRHIGLPKPGDWRQLCILLSRLHSRSLDMSRPPWEMYIIEGLDNVAGVPKGSFAILSKYHHATIDGASGIEIISGLHDLTAKPVKPELPPRNVVTAPPSMFQMLLQAGSNNVRLPFHLASVLTRSILALRGLPQRKEPEETELKWAKLPVPKTRFNQPVSPHRVFGGCELELSDFKVIRKAVEGVTINDVVLAVCAGALRSYLDSKNELPEEPLVAAVPINTRTSEDQGKAGNMVSGMIIALQTHIEDCAERLASIRDLTAAEKTMEKAVSARQLTDINHHVPAGTLALASRLVTATGIMHRGKPIMNCIITNVPGPQHPMYMCGAQLLSMWGCGPVVDGVGLFVAAHSYNGKVFLCVTSCRDIMPDPELFSDCMQQSFNELLARTRPKRKTKTKKKIQREN